MPEDMLVKVPKQYQDYLDDLQTFPENEYPGTYMGISWSAKRSGLGHWCGYLHGLNLEQINKIKPKMHGGITYQDTNTIGFDCAHFGDFSCIHTYEFGVDHEMDILNPPSYQTYITFPWVEKHIYDLIDLL